MSIQTPHPALLTPGPIEVGDDVLFAMRHSAENHMGRSFVDVFGESLEMIRKVVKTRDPDSQPFILSGSGTLGFDQVAANVFEPGDEVLILNVGYWGDSFAECLRTYSVNIDVLKAPLGCQPEHSQLEKMLRAKTYSGITITHCDTVSGVLSDVRAISRLVREVSPDTLIVVDGVCSVGSEDLRFDDWHLDVLIAAPQKGLGSPAGLSIVVASSRVMRQFENRRTRPGAYFCSWRNWLPVMRAYESRAEPLYYATPPSQLIRALHAALARILSCPFDERLTQHKQASATVKKAVAELGLKQLASKPEDQAHGMTTILLPDGIRAEHILPRMVQKGVVLARGPQKEIAGQYIRFAHMGVTATDPSRDDIQKGIRALKEALSELQPTR
ncbi:Alanine--glyoxylate aminotransferase 1 [Pseudocercospora fuligena]|uniref:alanine--glyoxylate transaminase n=1 Tax=Pseudocercospora fuligena TaxID=685502 RepID=A0A8H6RQP2_9PEZI|nr:Alanine--glyoxylate aminotransferase 1 [Pseudocercospora fuligena]